MSYKLNIECRRQPDVMERILRVIRHRGFSLQAMAMTISDGGEQMALSVEVDGSRPVHLLTTQIEKLHDVVQWQSQQSVQSLKTAMV